uniref:DUF4242 domain-containing protein n=1 Tax=Angiostrongylus cantonensis TaxID=6313 RepID=A0A0K0DHH0_ANGCA
MEVLGSRRTNVTICTYNARTLASESTVKNLIMQTRKIGCDVTGLAEERRRHPFNADYDTGEELFLGSYDKREVGGVSIHVTTSLSMNIDSFEQLSA